MHRSRSTRWVALLLPLLLGADAGKLISREAAPVPERLLGPLPARLDLASVTTSEWLRSMGQMRLPQFRHVRQRLCRGDIAERARFLDGVVRAIAEPGAPLRLAYSDLAASCEGAGDHCEWLASETDSASGAVSDFLWSALASCWPLDDAGRFESDRVPDDAVVSFYAKRREPERIHSRRLAAIVDRRVAARDVRGAQDALAAYARMDHPATASHLLRLYAATDDAELRSALAYATRDQSNPEASQKCRDGLELELEAWRRSGANPRASPLRFGDGCAREPSLAEQTAARAADDVRPDPLAAVPASLGRSVWSLDGGPGFQFDDHTGLLRELAGLLRPELDDVLFDDAWPAVDAVRLDRGPHRTQIFVNGDGVIVGVPDREGEPDLAVADAIRDELIASLSKPRVFELWWRGERFRFAHRGVGDDADVDAAFAITNFMLEQAGSARRVARLATSYGLGVLVAAPDAIVRARDQGLLAVPTGP